MGRPDLIVPIRDRRQHRRILTLKNSWRALLVLTIFFLGITVESDLRHPASDEYGRLFRKQVPSHVEVTPRKVDIVQEAPPIPEQSSADPLLLSAAAREQYLGVNGGSEPVTPPAASQHVVVDAPSDITITVGRTEPRRPVLSGGIFRQ